MEFFISLTCDLSSKSVAMFSDGKCLATLLCRSRGMSERLAELSSCFDRQAVARFLSGKSGSSVIRISVLLFGAVGYGNVDA